jgi:hypothetical protein
MLLHLPIVNPPNMRLDRLRDFWTQVTSDAVGLVRLERSKRRPRTQTIEAFQREPGAFAGRQGLLRCQASFAVAAAAGHT